MFKSLPYLDIDITLKDFSVYKFRFRKFDDEWWMIQTAKDGVWIDPAVPGRGYTRDFFLVDSFDGIKEFVKNIKL